METLTTLLITFGTGMVSAFCGWFFGRKKQRIEEIDAATETWKKIVNSLEEEIGKLLAQRADDSKKIDSMKEEIESLKSKLGDFNSVLKRVDRLEKKVTRYEKLLEDNNIEH